MANLVIKPTTNNSLKIQDQGGTERISLNTSGELSLPTVTSATIGSGVIFPAGSIINVTSTSITRASSQFTSTSFTDIADDQSNALSVSVTPKTNSKILLMATLMTGGTNYNIYLRFMRDSTAIGINTNPGNRPAATMSTYGSEGQTYETMSTSMQFLDTTPGGDGSTSIVYKIQLRVQSGGSAYVNRSERHTDETHRDGTGISTITAMEIAG